MLVGRYCEEGLRVRKDGSHFWADVTISALRDDNGQHVGFVKFTHDVSERKRSEELIRASLEEKEVMLKEIHHFGAGFRCFEGGRRSLGVGRTSHFV